MMVRAHFVGIGLYDFSDAYADVMIYAGQLGAFYLPDEHLDALYDWVAGLLTDMAAAVGEAADG
jgi:hypothetical protein